MTMEKKAVFVILAIAVLSWGCGASRTAPKTASDKQIVVDVFLDRGAPGTAVLPGEIPTEATESERSELAAWMENDLIRILNEQGYAASSVKALDQYRPGATSCLLKIVLQSYVPANRASRLEAGLGEGSTTVDIHYELFVGQGSGERRLFAVDRGSSSARSWEWVAGELNKKIAADITRRLKKVFQR
jgi:hypothetical protein